MAMSTKADYRELREIDEKITLQHVMALNSDGIHQSCTVTERQLRSFWAQVHGIKMLDTIKAVHGFFRRDHRGRWDKGQRIRRERNREIEKQRNRETEKQRNRETEKQRNKETK